MLPWTHYVECILQEVQKWYGGAVKAFFDSGANALSNIAKSHTLDQNKLIATIIGSEREISC